MDDNKKLIFVTTRLFWPTDSGRKVSLYHYCRGLHEVYGYDIYLYSFLEAGQIPNSNSKPDFIKEIRFSTNITKCEKLKNLICKSVFNRNQWPFQCSLFFSQQNYIEIRDFCIEVSPEVIIADMIRTAPYLKAFSGLPCKKILDMDDLLSKRYWQQANVKSLSANVTGQYSRNLSRVLNRILSVDGIKKLMLRMESKRLHRAEVMYAKAYDSVIFVSDVETNELNRRLGMNKAATVTMGVDYAYYAEKQQIKAEPNSLSFVGNFNVAANADTLNMIVTYILPLIKNKYTFYVIGPCADEVKKKYAENKNIIFTGRVNDLREYVKATQVFLAPIAYGSGIKTKILEAMAMGMPVITNSTGMEGIQALNGEQVISSDDFKELAEYVNELLNSPEKACRIGKAAQAYVNDYYRWETIYESFEKIGMKRVTG